MAPYISRFVEHVLAVLSSEAAAIGHELGDFVAREDVYTARCLDCGSCASVVCTAHRYEKFGGAFASPCEAGILPGMSNILVGGQEVPPPSTLTVQNFLMAGVTRFKNASRGAKPVNEVILHETVTSSAKQTVDVLNQRGLGVHFIVGSDGTVYQHGDLVQDELWHASQHNDNSVGIEVVNPYYPSYRPNNSPWGTVIDAPWAHKGKYTVPTPEQAEATCTLLSWLCGEKTGGMDIPREWVGYTPQRLSFDRVPSAAQRAPGIYAHHYFGHMDGCWLVLYCWLRMVAELEAPDAYADAVRRATGVRGFVDLSDLVVG